VRNSVGISRSSTGINVVSNLGENMYSSRIGVKWVIGRENYLLVVVFVLDRKELYMNCYSCNRNAVYQFIEVRRP